MAKRFSHSRLGVYRNCPRQYQFQYIDRVPKTHKRTANTEMGRIVHDILRRLYEVASFDRLLELDEALAQYDAAWDKLSGAPIEVTNENMAVDDYIHNGRKMLKEYYQKHKPFNDGKLIGVESTINFVLPGTLIPMQVKLDRLWKRPDGVVEIVDYKTGRYFPRGGRDLKFLDQMGLYQLGVQTIWPQYEQVEMVQPFLALGETIRYQATEEDLDLITERVRSTVMEVRNSERLGDFPVQEGPLCNYCDYAELCPAKRHERLLKEEDEQSGAESSTMQVASRIATDYIRLDTELKDIKARHNALKDDLRRVAGELDLTRVTCHEGEVTVKSSIKEKFLTKTDDAKAFAELNYLARELGLDEFFTLDGNSLMKDGYTKKRLEADHLEKLEKYVKTVQTTTVRVKLTQTDDDN